MLFASALVSGLVLGCIYALVGAGLNLIFGVVKVINFAQGSLLMLGVYLVYWTVVLTGVDPYLTLPVVVLAMAGLGYLIQVALINPVLRQERTSQLLITFGLAMAVENGVLAAVGPDHRSVATFLGDATVAWGEVRVSAPALVLVAGALVTFAVLHVFLSSTRMGTAIRAVAQQPDSAELAGIDVKRVYAIGTAVTGLAAVLISPIYDIEPRLGETFGVMAFIVVVMGGLGSVHGAALAGLILGVAQNLFATYLGLHLSAAFVFLVFLVVLFLRPQGIFSRRVRVA
jgi:branched-chain amino acid transport system permease protein